jgi:hypothetical protein
VDGFGNEVDLPLPPLFFAAALFDLSFTTFLDAALAFPLPFDFLRVAIASSSK